MADIFKKNPEQSQRTKLDGDARRIVIAAMRSDERPISVRSEDEGSAAILRRRRQGQAELRFRGREMAHLEPCMQLLNKVREEDAPITQVEADPKLHGRQMMMVLALE